jgi:hypothetical protein
MPLASATPAKLPARKRFLERIRSCFRFRLPAKESRAGESEASPLPGPKPVLALTPRQHALSLENLAGQKILAGDIEGAGPTLVASAFFHNHVRNPIKACRLLSRAALLYLKAGDSAKARLHYKAASDLADAWGLRFLSRHYQKCAADIPADGPAASA